MWIWIVFMLMIVIMIMGFVVQSKFGKVTQKYSALASKNGQTGAEVARRILENNGIDDITIIRGEKQGFSDHFNPKTKTISLSKSVYDSTSIAAISIAAHEVGHAIQYSEKSLIIKIRTSLVKPVMITQKIGAIITQVAFMFLMFAILGLGGASVSGIFIWIIFAAILTSGSAAIFSLVTLPVEYDASKRAKKNLLDLEIIEGKDSEEYIGVDKVLNSAAMTYVIGFLSSITSLLLYVLILLGMRN